MRGVHRRFAVFLPTGLSVGISFDSGNRERCMPTPAVRKLSPKKVRNFGQITAEFALSDLTQIQTASYARFLQYNTPIKDRHGQGLEEILQEIFPIESYDKQYKLEFLKYELG